MKNQDWLCFIGPTDFRQIFCRFFSAENLQVFCRLSADFRMKKKSAENLQRISRLSAENLSVLWATNNPSWKLVFQKLFVKGSKNIIQINQLNSMKCLIYFSLPFHPVWSSLISILHKANKNLFNLFKTFLSAAQKINSAVCLDQLQWMTKKF